MAAETAPAGLQDVWQALEATVARDPAGAAVLQGDGILTFAGLRAGALDLAGGLRRRGLRPGDRVLIHLDNGIAAAPVPAAVWAAGGIPCLCAPEDSEARVLDRAAAVDARLILSDRLSAGHDPPVCPPGALRGDPLPGPLGRPAAGSVVFTSGSTGRPKGVVQRHATLTDGIRRVARTVGFGHGDRLLCPVPWGHDYGWGQLLAVHVLGVTMVLPEAPVPAAIPAAIERHAATVLGGMPAVYAALTNGISDIRSRRRASVRLVMSTGAAMPQPVLDRLRDLFPQAAVSLNFGMTETFRSTSLILAPGAAATTAGVAIPGVTLRIVDDAGHCLLPGVTGEVVHVGAGVFDSYWGQPGLTARVRRPDPLTGRGVAVFSGDLGHVDDRGQLFLIDRKDNVVKIMGLKVAPRAVEAALSGDPDLAEIAVVSRPHDMLGAELIAYCVSRSGDPQLPARLRDHARQSLPPAERPRQVLGLAALPRLPSGKVDYAALRLAARTLR